VTVVYRRCVQFFLLTYLTERGCILNVTGAACDVASVRFYPTIRRTDILVLAMIQPHVVATVPGSPVSILLSLLLLLFAGVIVSTSGGFSKAETLLRDIDSAK